MNILPRLSIAHLPTPVESLERLSESLNGPRLLIKRDDQTGLAFGGNKTRKLELLLADAMQTGRRMLVTAGAIQSNHCRQTAAAAARYGFDCTLVLTGEPPEHYSGNLLLDRLFGAQIIWTDRQHREDKLQETFKRARDDGKNPYLVPYGGSSPVGAAAYALAIQEFLAQSVHADWMILASSSGGTHAGMVAGAHIFGYSGKILGISIDEPEQVLKVRVAALASQTAEVLGENQQFSADDIMVDANYLGEGYGVMGTLERHAIETFACQEGLLLDPVYTGRAAGGMLDLLQKGIFKKSETVLFWHTGGQPALFADKYQSELNLPES